ncbi:YqaA family protein [Shewanella intestini]|uniref:DedA family protein n=1 Tax=Shewanella intestini TaxID=2017544 RepID=A0ABS5HYC0_9GAMM|nr:MULTISPECIES: YqaA family protein [Shewanella]MBR9726543.1 DedA family protein [Shewanella intestini]MRG34891.1 DedA family protein [Shewanella sp. XMDDZSB0408]
MFDVWLMFSGAFLAATLLPGGSEVLLVGLLAQQPHTWLALLIAASVGNTLGALTSYYLGYVGRFAKTPQDFQSKRYRHALNWMEKHGRWCLLLSWLPLMGDVLCLLAGWLKLPIISSTLLILVGKTLRYGLIVWAVI